MNLLSLHFGHDSSACLYEDGQLKKFFLVERFTRKKYDHNIKSIIKIINDNIETEINFLVISSFCNNPPYFDSFINFFLKEYKFENQIKVIFNLDHHLNHAYLAHCNSQFDESIVIVVDGSGSVVDKNNLVEVESVFLFKNNKPKLLYKNVIERVDSILLPWDKKFKNNNTEYDYKNIFSIAMLYDIAAILTGNSEFDAGKAMGLSSYGSFNPYFDNIFLEGNTLNNNFFHSCTPEIKKFLKNPVNKITKNNYKLYADFCYSIQSQTQNAVSSLIDYWYKKTDIKKVCICGGYGLNIIANNFYIKKFPEIEFYFEPVCSDNGISIGAAINSYINLTGKSHISLKTTSFHGIKYDVSNYRGKTTFIKEIAKLLYENKSVAVYKGLAEAGQRALGNRSIFFNALNCDAKNIVNKIKKREWYRPFACMVLEEDANTYFDMGRIKSSPFMTICFPVRPEYVKIIPGVTHVDNTCRIQTVSKEDGYLYELLQEFKKLSGHGIVLNTSFNLAGKPLVETPEDAFNTLNNSCLDYLWFEETQQLICNTKSKFTFNYV